MFTHFDTAFIQLASDNRVTVWHISIYMAIFSMLHANAGKNPVKITRREIMELAHIRSIATYHKCIRELEEFGYVDYLPSYDPSLGSQIFLKMHLKD